MSMLIKWSGIDVLNINHRECSRILVKNPVRKETNKRTLLYTGLTMYNNLSTGYKLMHPKRFKRAVAKMKLT